MPPGRRRRAGCVRLRGRLSSCCRSATCAATKSPWSAFRGEHAELILPPTRALARARRLLAGLPGGGGTPLAAGIDMARELVSGIRRRGRTVSVVLLTDGRANVSRDGTTGHGAASQDALNAARAFRTLSVPAVLVDTSVRPRPAAKELAQAMAGALRKPCRTPMQTASARP